ncbi:hypothetical protein [Streptomyces sp. RPT161]|uniref:hypothetical protein n=1 Tax=Streptomyces sp. RPT161 TaxID=3015993 RepID=UPI0022B8C47A|nr:hypothetical protein [Streptomyces sp. RPT161]
MGSVPAERKLGFKFRAVIAAGVAVASFGMFAASASPATAAPLPKTALGMHTYNPHARLGSFDNPIIFSGGKQNQNLALLTPAQVKALNAEKIKLEKLAREHKVKTGRPQFKPNATMEPMGYNCAAEESMYWCDQEQPSIGWFDEGTYLGSDNHEYLQAMGNGAPHNFQVYVDQTWNNGQNWNGRAGVLYNQADVWTNSYYDGPGYQDRGCLYDSDDSLVACGPWH